MRKGEQKRRSIISEAERLFYVKGYEQTSVQDVIDSLGLSKGGFYHHFDSKIALLDAICDARAQAGYEAARAAVTACAGNAVDKLNAMFDKNGIWQHGNVDFIGLLLRAAYREDGALMREKLKQKSVSLSSPLLTEIILEGVREDLFYTRFPDRIGNVILLLGASLTDEIALMLAQPNAGNDDLLRILELLQVYRYTVERLLDAPFGSVIIYEMSRMSEICQTVLDQRRRMSWESWDRDRSAE